MQRRNVRPGPQLRGVIVSAGTLYPDTERLVGEAFGVPVTNRYGCIEAGDMACTCPAGRIHVNPFTHFLEVLDERGNPVAEGTGRVAVTLLTNYTMPLIRYDIQDMATVRREPSPCPCGREWQTLERVEGRTRTFFRCRDGSLLNPALIVRSMHHADRDEIIDCYQVVQEDFHRFTVRLTLLGGRDGEDAAVRELLGRMEPEIRGALGFDASISFSIEKEILPLPSGKHLYALSRLLDAE